MTADILTKAKEHFSSQRLKMISVPEWGDPGAPLVIHARSLSLAARDRIITKANGSNAQALVYAIIEAATDAAGNKLFTVEHKHALLHQVDPGVVARVGNEIIQAGNEGDIAGK